MMAILRLLLHRTARDIGTPMNHRIYPFLALPLIALSATVADIAFPVERSTLVHPAKQRAGEQQHSGQQTLTVTGASDSGNVIY